MSEMTRRVKAVGLVAAVVALVAIASAFYWQEQMNHARLTIVIHQPPKPPAR